MKSIIKKITALSALAITLFSCADFLDIDPVDTFSDKVVFGNLTTIDGYVTKRYTEMRHGFKRYNNRWACDESWNTFDWYGVNGLQKGQMSPDYDGALGTWVDVWYAGYVDCPSYFSAIQNCNLFFDQVAGMEALKIDENSTNLVNQYIGEMSFLRAFFYADLVSRYGGVPLMKKASYLDTPADEMYVARSSYEDCVEFIVEELDKAAELLPVRYADKWLGRATKGAALALKARVLLYAASELHNQTADASKWTAARDAIADIINLNENGTTTVGGAKVYELDPSYERLFRNPSSKEIIFEQVFSSEYGHYGDIYCSPNGFYGWSETSVSQGMVDAYEMEDGTMPDPTQLYGASNKNEKDHGKEYEIGVSPWDGRDPRFYSSIGCDGQMWKTREIEYYVYSDNNGGGRDSNKGGVEQWNASVTGYYLRKFMDPSLPVSWDSKSTVPWIYIRLGEMYLNYAEALYQTGDEVGAKKYLEFIRNRARGNNSDILPEITASGEDLMKAIQHERRIELAFEEHRFFDVRRWKNAKVEETKPVQGIIVYKDRSTGKKSYKLSDIWKETKFSDANYYLAIPTSERQRNPKLCQNPGYPGYDGDYWQE